MLKDRRVVVTGAASGIGRAIAEGAAQRGATKVVLADRDAEGLVETADLVRRAGADSLEMVVDLARADDIEAMIDGAARWAGGLDVLVNNAGVGEVSFVGPELQKFVELPEETWDTIHNINLKAMWLATKFAAPHLKESSLSPAIVYVASIAGLTGFSLPAYSTSKAATIQLARSAAINLAPSVRANCVCPGAVRTPLLATAKRWASGEREDSRDDAGPIRAADLAEVGDEAHLIPRLGEPDEIANVVCFLAGDEASFMTGAVVAVDGGASAWRGLRR